MKAKPERDEPPRWLRAERASEEDGAPIGICPACRERKRLLDDRGGSRHRLGGERICWDCHRQACEGGGLCSRCDAARKRLAGAKAVPAGDPFAFGRAAEDIAKGKAVVW